MSKQTTTARRRAQLHEMLAGWGGHPTEDEMREMFEDASERGLAAGPSVFAQEGRGWVGDAEEELAVAA